MAYARRRTALHAFVLGALAIGLASVPSSSSFVEYAQASRPRWTSPWAASPRSTNLLLVRLGEARGRYFVGLYGIWLPLPALELPVPTLPAWPGAKATCAARLCAFGLLEALACGHALVFALWQLRPRAWMRRHFTLSPDGLRAGRAHTLFTSALSHADPLHLAHNTLSLLSLRPLAERLSCAQLGELIVAGALASAAASAWWQAHEWRRGVATASLGASGVVLALRAASAARWPREVDEVYGVEMTAAHALLAQCALDVALDAFRPPPRPVGRGTALPADAGSAVDVGAHLGGALCGWWFARYRWR